MTAPNGSYPGSESEYRPRTPEQLVELLRSFDYGPRSWQNEAADLIELMHGVAQAAGYCIYKGLYEPELSAGATADKPALGVLGSLPSGESDPLVTTDSTGAGSVAQASWQPIETAPSKQTVILSRFGEALCVTAYRFGPVAGWRHAHSSEAICFEPTHWMPLPEPPCALSSTDGQSRPYDVRFHENQIDQFEASQLPSTHSRPAASEPRIAQRLADVVMMLDTPDAYNREYIAAVCRSILSSLSSTTRANLPGHDETMANLDALTISTTPIERRQPNGSYPVTVQQLREALPRYVSDWAREVASEAIDDMEDESGEAQAYYLARWFDAMRAVAKGAPAPANCDWPDAPFTFLDGPGEHDPCYVVMPGGAMLSLNHHATPGVDVARAKFIVDACNAALSRSSTEQQ